jgi:N-acetyl sugar amidotransferase
MDTTDPLIEFDDNGICNHCRNFTKKTQTIIFKSHQEKNSALRNLIKQIRANGKGKEYDCIVGLSGGVDSTYAAYILKTEYKLNPLIVHLDNGWNSELSVKNIEEVLKNLELDLHTHVIDWEEFKDLQLSYLKASVIDIEVLTDHAIRAILYRIACKYNLKYIINGKNHSSEAILPESWISDKNDLKNIKAIQKYFGSRKIKTFPKLGLARLFYYKYIKKIEYIPFLDYIDYVKEDAAKTLQKELNWRSYSGKHHESIFTKFFQSYILPVKFNIDKRKAHLSSLICSNQISREEALEELAKPIISSEELDKAKEYVAKKWKLSTSEFDKLIAAPPPKDTPITPRITIVGTIKF